MTTDNGESDTVTLTEERCPRAEALAERIAEALRILHLYGPLGVDAAIEALEGSE